MAIGATTTARTRTRPGTGATGGNTQGGGASWMKRGDDARQRAEAEIARQREAAARREGPRMPWRFWVPVGEQREIVVLDSQIGPSFYEHQLQNPKNGKWETYEACPKEWEPCPICMADESRGGGWGKESSYLMFLTVAELTPWTDKDGNEHSHSIRLLAVKAQQHGFFMRQFDRHGTLRGMHLLMSRDTKNTPNHGTPEFVQMHSEDDILESFGHEEVKNDQGKVIKAANADCFPVEYEKLFRQPSAEDIRTRYNLGKAGAPAGSRASRKDEWGDESGAADQTQGQTRRTGIQRAGTGRAPASQAGGSGEGGGGNNADPDLDDDIPF